MGFYGMLIGGWASGAKYALLGAAGGRALVSYEVAFTLSIIGVVMLAGTLSLEDIVNARSHHPASSLSPSASRSSTGRAGRAQPPALRPPGGRGEIVAGFHTEYGGMSSRCSRSPSSST